MDTAQRKVRKKTTEGYGRGKERGGGVKREGVGVRREGVGVGREGVGVRREGFLFFPPLSISRHLPLSERLEKARIVVFLNKGLFFSVDVLVAVAVSIVVT